MYEGKQLTLTQLDNGIVELCFDAQNAPVNVFNNATVSELTDVLDLLEKTDGVKGLLLTSNKSVFVAGADITEFEGVFKLPADEMKTYFGINNTNLNRLEDLPFPSVVAINGFALGGGLEVCLACDYRVMSSKAKVGLPETGLGIIPGWGGTVRTPRLIGLPAAMEWNATARHQKAEAALEAGLVDKVAEEEELHACALDVLQEAVADSSDYLARRARKTGAIDISSDDAASAAAEAKAKFCKRQPQLVAPSAVIDLIENAIEAGVSRFIM
ncbi:MAG: enoyl-CoA hydratase-related protein, partial [bacterium]